MSETPYQKAIQAHRDGDFQSAEQLYNQVLQIAKEDENLAEEVYMEDNEWTYPHLYVC